MNELPRALQLALESSGGALTFARFMELALYHPELGYYERREHTPGRRGDFFTSVSTGPLFGELLAHRFARWLAEPVLGEHPALVEAGAHDGRLAADVLTALHQHYPELARRVVYYVLEPSDTRAAWQAETLASFAAQVRRARSWEDLPRPLRGVIYSNELLDALPVHRLGWDAARQEWFEWGVRPGCGGLVWTRLALSSPALAPDLPQVLLEVLPEGFTVEAPVAALEWWRTAALLLAPGGRLMTLDYGSAQAGTLDPRRPQGTLRAFWRHTLQDDLLARPGEQDLTADVNFAAVEEAGRAAGLVTETLEKQGPFLTRLALELGEKLAWTAARRRQFMTLTHPQHMGERFCVLVQRRP
ncbi:SAM-dependent methyltransferase [Fontisphaera persica]|uniref:class I SAM-dependent methyltransferase n=1 Tax=Fontisphaera persica TaxID=2974023 RepID=UPI0024C06B13|nr:SAM-dependent methyltransferase [Fontisphaera persica]WCJ59067.1 SAM-dependent methyltransferase [Fontisphaera persica]